MIWLPGLCCKNSYILAPPLYFQSSLSESSQRLSSRPGSSESPPNKTQFSTFRLCIFLRSTKVRSNRTRTKAKPAGDQCLFVPKPSVQFSRVWLFATPCTAARQASLFTTNSRSLLTLTSIGSVMLSNHLILCRPLLLPPSVFPSIRVFSKESVLWIRWLKYWSFSFNISPPNEYSGLIFFRMDWLDLLALGKHRTGDLGGEISSQFQVTPTWFLRMSCANPINSPPRVKLLYWLFSPYPRKVGLIRRTGTQEN